MKKASLNDLPRLRNFAYIKDLTGRSRSSIYRDIDAGFLAKPIKYQRRNMWTEEAIAAYHAHLTGGEVSR